MLKKIKILGKAAKVIKSAQEEGGTIIQNSKPLAKKALGQISKGAIALGEKGRKIADGMSGESPTNKNGED
ncbi:MAG: hypothetical protein MK183_11690 [Verrucomicrobiales bacterium]|nr:hypothetical protein [Verrucomicrobiales bacterium]